MAKGDFGAAMGIGAPSSRGGPLDLATIIARLRATQGGGQMGPGGMMPNLTPQQNKWANNPAYGYTPPSGKPMSWEGVPVNMNPGGQQMPIQARPMFGGFQPQVMPTPGSPVRSMNNPFDMSRNTGIAGNMDEVNQTRKLQYLG